METTRRFTLKSKDGVKAAITITAANITSAEQNIVILDATGEAVALVQLLPGIDRHEVEAIDPDKQKAAAEIASKAGWI